MAKEDVAKMTPEASQTEPAEQIYQLSELKAASVAAFSVRPEVIDGALYGTAKQEFTKTELQGLINEFLKRTVQ